jgi:outer membrane lipoprotein-sorting protein
MRTFTCLAVALALTTSGLGRAEEKADPKDLIAKAIKATGGEENLAKFKVHTFKDKGKFYGMGTGVDYTGEFAIQHPDKMRMKSEGTGDAKFTFLQVVNGEKVWTKINDMKLPVDKDQAAEAQEAMYVGSVATLLPLKDKSYQLAPLGEVKVGGKPAVGVRVSHKGHRDVNLFFDKDKGLLVKTETVVKDPMMGNKELTQETLYSDYKAVKGTQMPRKVLINRDGKKFIESEVTEIDLLEKIDDSTFGEP